MPEVIAAIILAFVSLLVAVLFIVLVCELFCWLRKHYHENFCSVEFEEPVDEGYRCRRCGHTCERIIE